MSGGLGVCNTAIKNMRINNKYSAFTLIELLVVIAIIGILAALSLVSFTTSQRQARDTQRKSDIKQYSTALEGFANGSGGLYPSHTSTVQLTAGTNTLCSELGLTNCPGDPKTGDASYIYKFVSNGTNGGATTPNATKYILWARLESSSNYWVICSEGKTGTSPVSSWTDPGAPSWNCPI
jgi:prepilin-type N-terminal cleavage/methylation domain-containing protein